MENKKRILAWILSLAMVFGLFGGQASVAKSSRCSFKFCICGCKHKKTSK